MNEETSIWLFAAAFSLALANTGAIYRMRTQMKKLRLAVELFVGDMGKAAAVVLHSPDDHLGIDDILDKHIAGDELTDEDFDKIQRVCERIKHDKTVGADVRLAASNLTAALGYQRRAPKPTLPKVVLPWRSGRD